MNVGDIGDQRSGVWHRFLLADLTGLTDVAAGTTPSDANALMFPLGGVDMFYLGQDVGRHDRCGSVRRRQDARQSQGSDELMAITDSTVFDEVRINCDCDAIIVKGIRPYNNGTSAVGAENIKPTSTDTGDTAQLDIMRDAVIAGTVELNYVDSGVIIPYDDLPFEHQLVHTLHSIHPDTGWKATRHPRPQRQTSPKTTTPAAQTSPPQIRDRPSQTPTRRRHLQLSARRMEHPPHRRNRHRIHPQLDHRQTTSPPPTPTTT